MTAASLMRNEPWTRTQAATIALGCLIAGIAGGWTIRGMQTAPAPQLASAAGVPQGAGIAAGSTMQAPSAVKPDGASLKAMADQQAAPLLERLKTDPANPELLTELGNLYYDAKEYPAAVEYYQRALKTKPADASVRTDMGTAYWYMGDADRALAEFNQALADAPNNANTLFNRGLVRWKGKNDAAGALADWRKLLATDPSYKGKASVEQMIAEASRADSKPARR